MTNRQPVDNQALELYPEELQPYGEDFSREDELSALIAAAHFESIEARLKLYLRHNFEALALADGHTVGTSEAHRLDSERMRSVLETANRRAGATETPTQ